MIPHVAEEGASRLVDTGELGRGELPGQILHQPRDALKTDDLVPLGIEVADFLRVERRVHDAVLDQQQPVLDRVDHREIAVNDEVEDRVKQIVGTVRSEEHTSELQSLMRISYAVLCLKKKKSMYKKTDTDRTEQ